MFLDRSPKLRVAGGLWMLRDWPGLALVGLAQQNELGIFESVREGSSVGRAPCGTCGQRTGRIHVIKGN